MPADTRSFAEVLQDAVGNVQEIFRSEVRLAKTEITAEARKAAGGLAVLAGGAAFALWALGLLLLAGAAALRLALPPWGAALVMFVVAAAIAAALAAAGVAALKRVHPKPEATIRTVKENMQWLRNQSK